MREVERMDRHGDLTVHLCRHCFCTIRPGEGRRVTEKGQVSYEHDYQCRGRDDEESSRTSEPVVQDHFAEFARQEIAAMRVGE